MAESVAVDYVKVECRSGRGGPGSTHFRREKYVLREALMEVTVAEEDVYMQGNRNNWTLIHLRYDRHIFLPTVRRCQKVDRL